jgi:hypothetical protein
MAVPAMQHGHVMSTVDELLYSVTTHELRAADNEDAHRARLMEDSCWKAGSYRV